jgi:hypothetical protein
MYPSPTPFFFAAFSTEAKKANTAALYGWKPCRCSPFVGTRVPECVCDEVLQDVSSLLRVRWKRLVLDEGHVSAAIDTNLTWFAKLLSVERRWIVTGTPTTNLLGLSFGGTSQSLGLASEDTDASVNPTSIASFEGGESDPMGDREDDTSTDPVSRSWNIEDRHDLHKLSAMIGQFLSVTQFVAAPKLFSTHVIAPLFDKAGPQPGAVHVLEQVMQMVMVRHRWATFSSVLVAT